MNTLRDPVGPERKAVYVRRRLLVLAGILALVVFVLLVILKPGSSGGAATAPEVNLPEEIVAAEQPKEQSAADVPECAAGELKVTPITDRESYAAGELPQLSLSVENIGDAACQAQLGTSAMSFRITSGSDEVWRSSDCQVNPDSRAVILEPGTPLVTEAIEWDRTRSSTETCEITRDPVTADGATYHLQVAVGSVQGTGTEPFLLY